MPNSAESARPARRRQAARSDVAPSGRPGEEAPSELVVRTDFVAFLEAEYEKARRAANHPSDRE